MVHESVFVCGGASAFCITEGGRKCSSHSETLCDYTWQSGKSGPTKRLLKGNTALQIKHMGRILSCNQGNTLAYTNSENATGVRLLNTQTHTDKQMGPPRSTLIPDDPLRL